MSQKAAKQSRSRRAAAREQASAALTAEERSAMKELVQERKGASAEARTARVSAREDRGDAGGGSCPGRAAPCFIKPPRRPFAELWYGMPAYAKEGKSSATFRRP